MQTIARLKWIPSLATAVLLGVCCGVEIAAGAAEDLAPVERRANDLLSRLGGDEPGLRDFVASAFHPDFRDAMPVEQHLTTLGGMRESLGRFELADIRILGPARGEFVLESRGGGPAHILHVETESRAPWRIVGLRLEAHDPGREIPAFASLDDAMAKLGEMAARGAFSGVVLVAREGQPELVRAFGRADRERGVDNTPETRFDLGSITKALTAVAVLQLVEQGKIDLDATLGLYLDGFAPEVATAVKVRHLLRMESGFGDYHDAVFAAARAKTRTLDDYLVLLRRLKPEFTPGSAERYSNAGYLLLGAIIERVSGLRYPDYIRKHVYQPAGMTGSGFRAAEGEAPLTAVGYTRDGLAGTTGAPRSNRDIVDLESTPAGGTLSTAADLLRFNRALWANRLLKETSTTFLLRRFEPGSERPKRRGIAGGAPGVSAVSLEDRGRGVTVLVLANQDEPVAELVGKRLLDLLAPPEETVAASPAGETDAAVVVPMSFAGGQPAVEVRIGGEGPFTFLVDTGAGGIGRVSRRLAEKLGLVKVGSVLAGDPSGKNSEQRALVRVPELSLGGRRFRELDFLLAGEAPVEQEIDGILGFGLLARGLLTLDYPAGQLRIEAGTLAAAEANTLSYTDPNGIPEIEIDVAGLRLRADIDSGSMGGITLPERLATSLALAEPPRVVGKARTAFNAFEIKAAPLAGAVRIGGHLLERPSLEFSPIFPHANLGSQLLASYALTFDPRGKRVRFARPAGGQLPARPRVRLGLAFLNEDGKLTVASTVPGSAAARAGFRVGDRLLRIDGKPAATLGQAGLGEALGQAREIEFAIEREGRELIIRATPEAVN